jgi:hypothetical protein
MQKCMLTFQPSSDVVFKQTPDADISSPPFCTAQVTSSTPRVAVSTLVFVPGRALSGGAIAAIVFAALLAAALLAGGCYWLVKRRGAASQAGFGQLREGAGAAPSGPSRTAASFPGASAGSKARLAATQMHVDARAYERDGREVELGQGAGYGNSGYKVNLKGGSHMQLP